MAIVIIHSSYVFFHDNIFYLRLCQQQTIITCVLITNSSQIRLHHINYVTNQIGCSCKLRLWLLLGLLLYN